MRITNRRFWEPRLPHPARAPFTSGTRPQFLATFKRSGTLRSNSCRLIGLSFLHPASHHQRVQPSSALKQRATDAESYSSARLIAFISPNRGWERGRPRPLWARSANFDLRIDPRISLECTARNMRTRSPRSQHRAAQMAKCQLTHPRCGAFLFTNLLMSLNNSPGSTGFET